MLHKNVGGREVLGRTPILFIKLELHGGCFTISVFWCALGHLPH